MLARIDEVETLHEPPPNDVGVYRIWLSYLDGGMDCFTQKLVIPPTVGETWEVSEPQLQKLVAYPDGRRP